MQLNTDLQTCFSSYCSQHYQVFTVMLFFKRLYSYIIVCIGCYRFISYYVEYCKHMGAILFLIGNKASTNGGGIHVDTCNVISSRNRFSYNFARQSGGVIYALHAYIKDYESDYYNNVAYANGGVVGAYGSDIVINASVVCCNNASKSGGGFFLHVGRLIITESNIFMNIGNSAGVIAAGGASIFVHRCKFTHKGDQGGVINTDQVGLRLKCYLGTTNDSYFICSACKM